MREAALGSALGRATPRIDGRQKVTGEALYPADVVFPDCAYACLVTSAIARGRIEEIALDGAEAVPGFLRALTWKNTKGQVRPLASAAEGGLAATSIRPLDSPQIWHAGQIVALVVAESEEAAREAAGKLRIAYAEEPPSAGFDSPGTTKEPAGGEEEVGEAEAAFAAAPVKIDARYETPTQHHNPLELFTTTCAWNDGALIIHEPSQFVQGLKQGVARQLDLPPDRVRVLSPFVGGAFGSKASITPRTALVALAARQLGRPVKLVPTRMQGFTLATHRAETRHRLRLAADREGRLQALIHEGQEVSSRPDAYSVAGTDTTARLYACPNVATRVEVLHADRDTPGFMRSPAEVPYVFALESAMDELAEALNLDPVELRRRNDTDREPIGGKPYSSRALMRCFDAAAEAFGWSARDPRPGAMREGDWLIGWGCAAACYPTVLCPAAARVTLRADGGACVETSAEDIGTGAYTALALAAAEALDLPVEMIEVKLGDSSLPAAPVAGGSNLTASVCNAVWQAAGRLRARLLQAAVRSNAGPFAGSDPTTIRLTEGWLRGDGGEQSLKDLAARSGGPLEGYAETLPEGLPPEAMEKLRRGELSMIGGPSAPKRIQYAFGAEFVEVRVHARTREIRTPRVVGAFAAGRIVNPLTAKSQLMGGLIWGIGSALHEATEIDRRSARYTNQDLSEYLIPVNADIEALEVILLPEEDRQVNPLGIKGLGELGNVGTAAAVANAVHHATGRRVRDLPIRMEKLL